MLQVFRKVISRKGKIIVEDVPSPTRQSGCVLIGNAYSLISSGTESHTIELSASAIASQSSRDPQLRRQIKGLLTSQGITATAGRVWEELNMLRSLGYSGAGVVLETGDDVPGIHVGDKVAYAGSGHADILNVPKNLCISVPDEADLREAAFVALGSIAIQGIRRARVQFGETAVVMGLGLIGQLSCQILAAAGVRVIGLDFLGDRVELAIRNGIETGIVLDDRSNPVKLVLDATGTVGADAVLICAASRSDTPANQAMEMCRKKGRVVVVGAVGMNLERKPFYAKELDFVISTSYGPGRYDTNYEEKGIDYPLGYVRWTENRNMAEFIRLVSEKRIHVDTLISGVYTIEEAQKAYDIVRDPKRKVLGVLLEYTHIAEKASEGKKTFTTTTRKKEGVINVGVIGCGGFARGYHLPNLHAIPEFHVQAVADINGSLAKQVAEKYNADYCSTDYQEILRDEHIDMVVITTRHHLHAPMAIAAATAHKHIFIEKPLSLNEAECLEVVQAVREHPVLFTMGFNRRFAPLAIKTKASLRGKPMFINYMVNSKRLPLNHWVNDPVEGGGRMVGEACHFFDLLYWFIEEEPLHIVATEMKSEHTDLISENNFTVTVHFRGGSMANLMYSDLGHQAYPKERIEIFSGGDVAVIHDFKTLTVTGETSYTKRSRKIDKGHFNELVAFAKALKGKKELEVTIDDALRATQCSFRALESMRTGQPQGMPADGEVG